MNFPKNMAWENIKYTHINFHNTFLNFNFPEQSSEVKE